MVEYKRERMASGVVKISIGEGSEIYASFGCTDDDADEFENMVARIANRRNKKAAAARRERQKKITNRTRELYCRGDGKRPYEECHEQAVREVDS